MVRTRAVLACSTSHFSNYIGLLNSGRTLNDEGEEDADGIPEYTYSGVRARFVGFEAQDHWKLGESAYGKNLPWNCRATTPAPPTWTPAKPCLLRRCA